MSTNSTVRCKAQTSLILSESIPNQKYISDLLRRLNPKNTATNLSAICSLVPEHEEELLASVDQPLEVRRCKKTGRDYLLCDYNRDGDSYRSPWSNEFDPPVEDAEMSSERVRRLEVRANEAFDVYRELEKDTMETRALRLKGEYRYYEGGTSSVYLWNLDDGFAGVVLLKKSSSQTAASGAWDSIHVLEVAERGRTAKYKLTSTVILNLGTKGDALGSLDLAGNMTRQVEADMPVDADETHVANIGKLVEDMELKMRNLLQEVYFGKAKDVVGDLRSIPPLSEANRDRAAQREMISSMGR
ncbi:F-actin capping protein [Aureobasidium pullulans]|uniref:F-actin-capping protein subunit beta n=1 Tax=Aureobasidium pullulans TaxID=5580 RepID=A0A4V4I1H7_AURPU|nr:F-actin capping protein [Aureobasidium pullulans]